MTATPSFLGFPDHLSDGHVPRAVIFGAGHGSTYRGQDSSGHAEAANAIRIASRDDAPLVEHWDFDLGGPLFNDGPGCCTDAGDILTIMHDNAGNRARIEAKTREVLSLPAVPIMLGGDDSVVIPFLAGFADRGPIWILQIDAHIDWRDEVHGERHGYSSPKRRASEMPHVAGMVQVGLRSVGSARHAEIEAARRYGSRFVTAREVHAQGVEVALRHIPEGAQVVVTLDCDGLDPGTCRAWRRARPAACPTPRRLTSLPALADGHGLSGSTLSSFILLRTLTACRHSPPHGLSSTR